jgi:hypothetical protein
MKTIDRIYTFSIICIGIRIALVLLIYFYPEPYWAILTGLIALGFFKNIFYGKKKGFFGGNVYWSRDAHFINYAITTALLIPENTRGFAYLFLAIDVIEGYLTSALYYHFKMNN